MLKPLLVYLLAQWTSMNSPPPEYPLLSKSTFMRGQQCSKALWLHKNRPEFGSLISASQQMVFDRGKIVGILARQLFLGGMDASPIDPLQYSDSINRTYNWIETGMTIIYEAAFQFNNVVAALDILVKVDGKWFAYEVKSSTDIRPQYIMDAALQYYIMTGCGMTIEDIFIIHLNNEYSRMGSLDLKQLFTCISLKSQVIAMQPDIPRLINQSKEVLHQTQAPVIGIGPHCSDPYECEFMGHCWSHIPEPSIFDLCGMKWREKFGLYDKGIIEFRQLPDGFTLSANQSLQVKAWRETSTYIDVHEIQQWLQKLRYPLYFMDFETFAPAIPLYSPSRPYQPIPFQFSVHVQHQPGSILEHHEFLGEPENDPRPEFLGQLLEAVEKDGTVLVYNQAFERSRLKELKQDYPSFAGDIDNLIDRLADLMLPFQKRWYYSPKMNGSYSIKFVLPALIPDMSYKEMEISDGGSAMAAFEGLSNVTDPTARNEIRSALLDYCKLDTLAMVRILEKLAKVI